MVKIHEFSKSIRIVMSTINTKISLQSLSLHINRHTSLTGALILGNILAGLPEQYLLLGSRCNSVTLSVPSSRHFPATRVSQANSSCLETRSHNTCQSR
jgi:hypothetical protein